ncbi:MAG: class I SAM-dependent methyltransferase [Pseudomonadota bacterium]
MPESTAPDAMSRPKAISSPHVPDFAFDPSDPWTETFQEGLRRAELSGKRVYEVGLGTGMNAVFLLRTVGASAVSGSDLDPRLAELAARNVQALLPSDAHRFQPVLGAVSLIDTDAARAKVARTDTVIACLPQVTCPKDEKFAVFREAHDIEIGEGAQNKSADHIAHYYPWEIFDCLPFNAVGLGLNEALLRRVRVAAPKAELVMNFGARIPKETICAMFEANGYAPELLHSRIVEQDAGTDISFFVTLETAMQGTGLEQDLVCAFFADADGKVPLSARAAQQQQEIAPEKPLYHEVCVIRAKPC